MKRNYEFYVYIMASEHGTLYVGMTNDLARRVEEHKSKTIKGFTSRYDCTKLVYAEFHQYVFNAIEREKQIKSLSREKKESLIKTINPSWNDLSFSGL